MQSSTGIPSMTPPRRDGPPGWLIALLICIPIVLVAGSALFVVRSRQQHLMEQSVFFMAVTTGNMVDAKRSLDANPSLVNDMGELKISPLGTAAGDGNIAMMELLMARGADINGRAHDGFTPLHEAAVANRTAAANLLLAHGAKIDAPTDSGITPLYYAAMMGKKEVAEVLVTHGANVNAKTSNGATPLHTAATLGSKAVVEVLVVHGADVNARANDGSTPLKNALKQLNRLNGLPPNEIKARKARREREKKEGRLSFEPPTPERCRQVVAFLRQHGGKE